MKKITYKISKGRTKEQQIFLNKLKQLGIIKKSK